MSHLPRAHTHPTTRPLTSLTTLPPTNPKARTTHSSPLASPSPTRSPKLRAIPRSALTSPLHERAEDPFCVAGFFGSSGGEGEFGWVRAGEREEEDADPDGEEDRRLDGEDELGVEECVRQVLNNEDRMGILGLSLPPLSQTPSSGSPSPPHHPHTYAYNLQTTHTSATTSYTREPHPSDPYTRLQIHQYHGPETEESLHESFAARTRAVSYPDLVMLASKRAPPSSTGPRGQATSAAAQSRGRVQTVQPMSKPGPGRARAEVVYTRRETSTERRSTWSSTLPPMQETEVGGLFFDNTVDEKFQSNRGVDGPGRGGLGGKAKTLPLGLEGTGAREGWRVWALERAARAVGLD